jgi:hypothetical protein
MHNIAFLADIFGSASGQFRVVRLTCSSDLVTFFNYMHWQFEPERRTLSFFARDADFAMVLAYYCLADRQP